MTTVEEIKTKLDLVDVIQEYIPLKQAGTHNLKACCPFHNEKTPSFMVSRDKQVWHCFGCSKGGDMFSFVQDYEGMNFPEALRHLAGRAGVQVAQHNPAMINQKTRLLDILSLTTRFYQEYLLKKPEAQIARDYLKQRQIKPETIEQFKIGYSPNSWDETRKFLLQRKYTDEEILLLGLLVKQENSNKIYDRFRGRLMFPIFGHNGEVLGFGARALHLSEEKGAKYINSPQSTKYNKKESVVYDKSGVLYGLNFAKQEIKKSDKSIIVEGYLDVISSHQVGVLNVVASSGTALTQQQVKILKRYSPNIALCFDADVAGENAAKRGVEVALEEGMEVQIVTLPEGKDPDECIKNNPEDWKNAVENTQDFMTYYFNKVIMQFDLQEVSGKKQSSDILLPIIKKIADPVERVFWMKKLADKLDVDESVLRDKMKGIKEPIKQSSAVTPSNHISSPAPVNNASVVSPQPMKNILRTKEFVISEKLVAAILVQPPLLEIAVAHLTPEMLTGQDAQSLYKNLIIYYTETINSTTKQKESFDQFLNRNGSELNEIYKILEMLAAKEFGSMEENDIKQEALDFIDNIKATYLLNKRRNLQRLMTEAEEKGDIKKIEYLLKEFNKLT